MVARRICTSKFSTLQSDKSCSFLGVGDVIRREHEKRPAAQKGCVVEYIYKSVNARRRYKRDHGSKSRAVEHDHK